MGLAGRNAWLGRTGNGQSWSFSRLDCAGHLGSSEMPFNRVPFVMGCHSVRLPLSLPPSLPTFLLNVRSFFLSFLLFFLLSLSRSRSGSLCFSLSVFWLVFPLCLSCSSCLSLSLSLVFLFLPGRSKPIPCRWQSCVAGSSKTGWADALSFMAQLILKARPGRRPATFGLTSLV